MVLFFLKEVTRTFRYRESLGGNRILANRLSLAVGLLGILYTQPHSLQSSLLLDFSVSVWWR